MDDVFIFKFVLVCVVVKVLKEGVKLFEKNEIEEFLKKIKLERWEGNKCKKYFKYFGNGC